MNVPKEAEGVQLRSDLTEREIATASEATFDLGAGYLRYSPPEWIQNASAKAIDQFRQIFNSQETDHDYLRHLDHQLLKLASDYLGLPENSHLRGCVTFSGSIALSRAIAGLVQDRSEVVVVSPSIDIIPAMFAEHRSLKIKFCLAEPPGFLVDVRKLERMLGAGRSVPAFTSPENPTGNVIDQSTMRRIAELAASKQAGVLVDHTFCKVKQGSQSIPLWPHFAGASVDWAIMWDTGKTFPCLNEKLGFLFMSESLQECIQSRINITQFDVSLFSKLLFLSIFGDTSISSHEAQLEALLSNNRKFLEQALGSLNVLGTIPQAGSFALIDLQSYSAKKDSKAVAQELLLEAGVGVISCDCFFPAEVRQHARIGDAPWSYLRVALGRGNEYFETATKQLAKHMHSKR